LLFRAAICLGFAGGVTVDVRIEKGVFFIRLFGGEEGLFMARDLAS